MIIEVKAAVDINGEPKGYAFATTNGDVVIGGRQVLEAAFRKELDKAGFTV